MNCASCWSGCRPGPGCAFSSPSVIPVAFAELARPGSNHCGFLAESADREAEGCSAAIEARDFKDYSTHFFAALAGHGRLDKIDHLLELGRALTLLRTFGPVSQVRRYERLLRCESDAF